MTDNRQLGALGFHSGELAVQQQAGVQAQAARLAPMVSRGELRSGLAAFLSDTTFAALTARDRTGRLWTSPLLGLPGLLRAASSTVEAHLARLRAHPPECGCGLCAGANRARAVGVFLVVNASGRGGGGHPAARRPINPHGYPWGGRSKCHRYRVALRANAIEAEGNYGP